MFILLVCAIMSAFFVGMWTGATQSYKAAVYDRFEPQIREMAACRQVPTVTCGWALE